MYGVLYSIQGHNNIIMVYCDQALILEIYHEWQPQSILYSSSSCAC